MMDDRAEMLDALGDIHRQAISVPGQSGFAQSGVLAQRFEQRQAMAHNAARAHEGNDPDRRFAKTSDWNNPAFLGGDPMVDGLPNAFSGQGHRDQLLSDLRGSRGGQGGVGGGQGSHVDAGSSKADPTAAPSVNNRKLVPTGPSIPKGLPSIASDTTSTKQAKAPSTTNPGQQPQPRSTASTGVKASRTEIGPAKKANIKAEATQVRMPITPGDVPPTPKTTGPRAAATSILTSIPRNVENQSGRSRASATAGSPEHGAERASFNSSSARTSATANGGTIIRVPRPAVVETPAPQPAAADRLREGLSSLLRSPATAPPTPQTVAATRDHYRNAVYTNVAKHYASNPGPESDQYFATFPDRRPYLDLALKNLAEAANPDAQKTGGVVKAETMTEEAPQEEAPVEDKALQVTVKKDSTGDAYKSKTAKGSLQQQPVLPAAETARQDSASSVHSSPRSAVTAASESTGFSVPSPRTPATPVYGKLVVSYYNAKLTHLMTANVDINAPVQANIQITSKADAYDPCALEKAIIAFANTLRLDKQSIRLVRTDDGLWQEMSGQEE